jgi:hypothetical protein
MIKDNTDKSFELQKDNPGAYINKDMKSLQAYKEARNKILFPSSNNEINNLKEEIKELKDSVHTLTQLLQKVLESK